MPSETGLIDQVAPQKLNVSEGELTLALNWVDAAHKPASLEGVVVVQDKAGQQTALWIRTVQATGAASGSSATTPPVSAPSSLWQMLLFAFLGGLILNLMPCVFPVLAMKAFSLVRLGGGKRHEQITSALAYTTG
ncbi:hypothetical protein [Asaia prunellae]|uniref:hypothetical protein n=1 Tax=Asaia prunellae TaxID=610245 RepID=UPI000AB5B122|nr:hypothetical protein [Asaia prunellae]